MAGLGHQVTGVDFSPAMIEQAAAKAKESGYTIPFVVMDAAEPQFPAGIFDVIVCRHLLWALPETAEVLTRWAGLLRKDGRLILIEGFWETGSGLHAADVVAAFPDSLRLVKVEQLIDWQDLWGKPVTDERYMIVGEKVPV
jgi:ubiquinone/menaquinone biosynthesis C-methylase UbiE